MSTERNMPSQTGYTQINEDDYTSIRVSKADDKINIRVGHPTAPFDSRDISLNVDEAKIIQHAIYKMIEELKQQDNENTRPTTFRK